MAGVAHVERRGRPSLEYADQGGCSPSVHFRVPPNVREALDRAAVSEDIDASAFVRRALVADLAARGYLAGRG